MRLLIGCVLACWAGSALAQSVDFRIYDSFGASYSAASIGEDLGALYNIGFDPVMVVIVGPGIDDERVSEQRTIARGLDPDETGVLYAIGTPSGGAGRGYSINANTAAELLPAADAFRVLVIDAVGDILIDSDSVLSAEEILAVTPNS